MRKAAMGLPPAQARPAARGEVPRACAEIWRIAMLRKIQLVQDARVGSEFSLSFAIFRAKKRCRPRNSRKFNFGGAFTNATSSHEFSTNMSAPRIPRVGEL